MEVQPETGFSDDKNLQRIRKKPQRLSLNQIYREDAGSHCGYCQKDNTSFSWAFTMDKMDSYTYELLIERGWRRCGTYYYKPNLATSCCKLFTHRLEVQRFRTKKDQRRAIKRVIMIAYDRVEATNEENPIKNEVIQPKHSKPAQPIEKAPAADLSEEVRAELEKVCAVILQHLGNNLPDFVKEVVAKGVQFNLSVGGKLKFFNSREKGNSDYYSNLVMLIYGLNKKLFSQTKYTLLDFVKEVKPVIEKKNPIISFKIEVERGGYLLFKRLPKEGTGEFQLLDEKQERKEKTEKKIESKQEKMEIEGQGEDKKGGFSGIFRKIKDKFVKEPTMQQQKMQNLQALGLHDKHSSNFQVLKPEHRYKGEFEISHNCIKFGKLTIDIVKAEENIEAFNLYQRYSKQIHGKNEKHMSAYVNFLCLQGLDYREDKCQKPTEKMYVPSWDPQSKHQKPKPVTGNPLKLVGCYHMKYMFKGKLIGVGVVDIVDNGLSSVYFFYDPDYKSYRLGVFSSMIEIEYVRWMSLSFPQFRYYYMGFYVADTDKMNYKVDYMPCELLCPITYQFVQLTEEVKHKVDTIIKLKPQETEKNEKLLRLSSEETRLAEDMDFGRDIGPYVDKYLKLEYNKKLLTLKSINPAFFVHILTILKKNLRVYGKKFFEAVTFTL